MITMTDLRKAERKHPGDGVRLLATAKRELRIAVFLDETERAPMLDKLVRMQGRWKKIQEAA